MRSKWNGEPPYREIDFGFVLVRAVRAGEAKLRGRARGKSPVAEARPDQMIPFRGAVARGVPPVSRWCPVGVPMMMMLMSMMMVLMVLMMMMRMVSR